jgi:alpha-1,2-mannosyltransferase
MTYRARHARAATPVSPQVRGRFLRAWQRTEAQPALPGRLARLGTPLLMIGGAAFALALARFILHAIEPSFVTRMFDLGIYRDGGLIVRHAYHFRSGHPTPLYDWVSPGGGNPFTYPPFAAAIFAAASFLSPLVLAWGMTVLSLAALVCALWLTLAGMGLPRSRARSGALLAASAVALWTQPVQSNLGLGQINLLLMAAVIWDLRPSRPELAAIKASGASAGAAMAGAGSPWWTGIATGIAAGIKLTPLIFIPYLLVTRRFRQAGVAAGAFAVTVGIGFAVMPGASATYWQSGLLDRANGTPKANVEFFFASAWNQSLRGYLSRLLQHAQVAVGPWLIAAGLTLVIGLVCAAWLHRDGYPMLGVLACAVTGLLISPVSWLHHWVWAAPWVAVLGGMALLARGASWRVWLGIAGLVTLAFGNFPVLPVLTGTRQGLDVIFDVPVKQPLTWDGFHLIAGNMYVIAGAAGLLALFGWGIVRAFAPGQAVVRPAARDAARAAQVTASPPALSPGAGAASGASGRS